MKHLGILFSIILSIDGFAQKKINDKGMTHQQERMVYKQWDKNKFTPSTKVLGVQVNPLWFVVWGMHPNYINTDHRPLSPAGPQTIRIGLTTAMKNTSDNYKQQSDTLNTTALKEYTVHNNIYEPLWDLYYSKELEPVLNSTPETLLQGLSPEARQYLIDTKLYERHVIKMAELKERLTLSRSAVAERGNRILYYHKLMLQYRTANEWWLSVRNHVPKRLSTEKKLNSNKEGQNLSWTPETDKELAEKVVRESKYIN
jgi:hypothetical protein